MHKEAVSCPCRSHGHKGGSFWRERHIRRFICGLLKAWCGADGGDWAAGEGGYRVFDGADHKLRADIEVTRPPPEGVLGAVEVDGQHHFGPYGYDDKSDTPENLQQRFVVQMANDRAKDKHWQVRGVSTLHVIHSMKMREAQDLTRAWLARLVNGDGVEHLTSGDEPYRAVGWAPDLAAKAKGGV